MKLTIRIHTRIPRLYKVILQYDLNVLAFAPGFPLLGHFVTFIELVMWLLAIDQLNAQMLVLQVYYIPLHVSSTVVLIIRRSNCTASGIVTVCRWPSGAPDGHLQSVTIPDAV
jgi:hypothetical protein